jgi:feruloyl esterase
MRFKLITATCTLMCVQAAFGLVAAACFAPTAAHAAVADECAALAGLNLHQVGIDSATTQKAGAPVAGAAMPSMTGTPGGGPPISGLPAFCRVIGHIHPEPGSDIRFEVWMPSTGWNRRLNGGNNGGFAGSIAYNDLAQAVRGGQAGSSTDTGHTGIGTDSTWAKGHPELIRDYGWRAIHLTAVVSKQLVAHFYGRKPDHAYFVGCSNGGRQALIEASRFPDDYDGIVAGAPAAVFSDVAMSMLNTVQAQMQPGAAIRPEQAKLLQSEVVKQCDALDGQTDGLVADPRQCNFDASKLACRVSHSPLCFSPRQIIALKRIQDGPRDGSGHRVASGFPPSGAEVGVPVPAFGWDGAIFGTASAPASHQAYPGGILRDFFATPFANVQTFDLSKDTVRFKAALAVDVDAKPQMERFFERGGKLIIWQGWADPLIPPEGTLNFHLAIQQNSGPRAKNSERLFMIPGVQHCAGGTGADVFGQIGAPPANATPAQNIAAALQAWVETGRAPESLEGRRGLGGLMGDPYTAPEKERLLCAYPARDEIRPGADPDRASSYNCR